MAQTQTQGSKPIEIDNNTLIGDVLDWKSGGVIAASGLRPFLSIQKIFIVITLYLF
jgi:hypothetical protein